MFQLSSNHERIDVLHKTNSRYVSPRGTPFDPLGEPFVIRISYALFLNVQEGFNYPEIMRGSRRRSPGEN